MATRGFGGGARVRQQGSRAVRFTHRMLSDWISQRSDADSMLEIVVSPAAASGVFAMRRVQTVTDLLLLGFAIAAQAFGNKPRERL